MRISFIVFTVLILQLLFINNLFAQSRPYEGPDDPAGDIAAERAGWMTGNRVLLFFRNTTELGDCCDLGYDVAKWPNNYEGTKSHDGICLLIGARVYVENDSIPVDDYDMAKTRTDLDTLYYCQSSFREFMDHDPTETIEWALYPVFGYFNELSETPAMSNREDSWPLAGWPARGNTLKWPGEWNGRFGRGVMKADQECYYVANDAQDQEYLGPEDTLKYYPRPGIFIGDKKPDVTIQKGLPWGGIGIRVETRGFQWSNPSAMDAIFFEYTIANISKYNLNEMYFGIQIDNSVGGEEYDGADDNSYFNKRLNLCYSWDLDGIPLGGGKEPGVLGVAYLESPGIPNDGRDNDQDGLLDEKRDNKAENIVGAYDGIYNLDDYLSFYNLKETDLKEHWDADEDQDWRDGTDANNNNRYDIGEDPGDDLGLDGVGPYDLNYEGPDEDGTECNHKPDLLEGIGAEPNFGLTDVNESDMLGLTSFRYLLSWIAGTGGPRTAADDESIFLWLNGGVFDDVQLTGQNYIEQFASGLFPLHKGLTERISMSELHAYDPLAGLNSANHKSPALFRLKEVVQLIYESDYRFAQPPLMPTLTATPGDGKVFIYWDDKSDKFTRDSFVKNANDFEGYKLYRATDPFMADPMTITDGAGSPLLRQPIFQCDKIDNKTGFTDFGLINGMGYFLGDDSGLSHWFTDNTVQNGRTYYYVLVAYDYGIPEVGLGIPPSENTFVLEVDENENIRRISPNVAVVKPHQLASGYHIPGIEIDAEKSTPAAQKYQLAPEIYDHLQVKKGHTYKVKLAVNEVQYSQTNARYRSPYDALFLNDGIMVYDMTSGDTLIYQETKDEFVAHNLDTIKYVENYSLFFVYHHLTTRFEIVTDVFDGLRLRCRAPFIFAQYDADNSGWIVGHSPMNIHLNQHPNNPKQLPHWDKWRFFPWHYEIVWTDNSSAYETQVELGPKFTDHRGNFLSSKEVLLNQAFNFYVVNKSFTDSSGSNPLIDMIVYDVDQNGMFNADSDYVLVGDAVKDSRTGLNVWGGTIFAIDFFDIADASQMPQPNDVYRLDFKRPFYYNDSLVFTVTGLEDDLDESKIKEEMENIRVVPNPYVVTNTMEPAVANWDRNQRRQLMFTHIPAQCTIRIFTVSGVLVDEIDVDNAVANRQNFWDLNSEANGTVHWDLRSKEGLEIAAGYYLYHVESKVTGDVKIGKFAVIK
jgi:hypothetical protein